MRGSTRTMFRFEPGQILHGKRSSYTITAALRNRQGGPWLAMDRVTVKAAPAKRLENEARMLRLFQGCDSIRQLVDEVEDPRSLVLEYMDDNVFNLLKTKHLPRAEAKRALKATVQALIALHEKNIVHTDIKPDNILVKHSPAGALYKLGDLGDCSTPDVPSNNGGHLIGAKLFCAPEVPLGIPWTVKVDIWGFGATGITLITGRYVFLPRDAPPPGTLHGLADDSILPLLQQFEENYQPFPLTSASAKINQEDLDFFGHIMKIDPRQRPTANEILGHPWFNGV
ncbi:kinase-like domain-containing protein [Achaetomium macrosporum]|uniref:Kinase-like domain-containing protein n=1 Tax=Achaetomium macrosporum TaxID=79813 RepID=A0AAN7HIX2_9PEZI|nr:kinase-like domain-containing protein [Achaetomium macrosporum]